MLRKLLILLAVLGLVAAACGDSDDDSSPATTAAADTGDGDGDGDGDAMEPAVDQRRGDESVCGLGTGEEATGTPIKLGGMATNVPGIDFTWATDMARAYFDCVNDNGGIYGHPIEYVVEEEQIDPQQIASLAVKLVEEEGALGLVGSMSILDCSVNTDYYTEQGYSLIVAGVDHACFTAAPYSAVNMGPYYSSLGGAQAALRAGAEGKMAVLTGNVPGVELINSGVVDFANENGLEGISLVVDVPIADPATEALKLVETVGEGGAVVLDLTGPTVLPLLQAIEQQGLIDSVIWASSTPPNDPSIAEALSAAWNDKFLINAEFTLLDSTAPDATLLREVRETYADHVNLSAFGQMGFLAGRFATQALLDMGEGAEYTAESVNAAFKGLTNVETDILCAPWYFDSGVGANVSNNIDLTVVPRDGVMVQAEECFEIAELPADANQLAEIRAAEEAGGLNVGR